MRSSIDELIGQLGLRSFPIATWPGRHDCEFLAKLAECHSRWPTCFHDYADRVLRFANYWSHEHRVPIVGLRDLDRRGSFVGGFPWTSEAYPWPQNGRFGFLAPILQLNLATLEIGTLGLRSDTLFQVWAWGEDGGLLYRSIPLDETLGDPDWSLREWTSSDMYYRFEGFSDKEGWLTPTDVSWYDGKVVGEYVRPSPSWEFSVGRELEMDPEAQENHDANSEDVKAYWRALKVLSHSIPQLNRSCYDESDILSGIFGGQMYAQQISYDQFPAYRTLFMPNEGGDLHGSDRYGLYIWFDGGSDGKLSVLFNDHVEPSDLIACTD